MRYRFVACPSRLPGPPVTFWKLSGSPRGKPAVSALESGSGVPCSGNPSSVSSGASTSNISLEDTLEAVSSSSTLRSSISSTFGKTGSGSVRDKVSNVVENRKPYTYRTMQERERFASLCPLKHISPNRNTPRLKSGNSSGKLVCATVHGPRVSHSRPCYDMHEPRAMAGQSVLAVDP
jgi:hypothetical protein